LGRKKPAFTAAIAPCLFAMSATRLGAHDLAHCESALQANAARIEPQHLNRDRARRMEHRGVRQRVQPDARRDGLSRSERRVIHAARRDKRQERWEQDEEEAVHGRSEL